MKPAHLVLVFACVLRLVPAQTVLPAHSHNDYLRNEPLFEALRANFRSIEADVHLEDGELLVGHDPADLRKEKTIQKLYLDPLRKFFEKDENRRLRRNEPLILLVDLKTGGEETYERLESILQDYKPMLTVIEDGKLRKGPVQIVVSGNRPRALMQGQVTRLAAYDGRMEDLGLGLSPEFVPLVSDNWQKHFAWRGQGEFSSEEKGKLKSLVEKAHGEGRLIRFWASPDLPAAWTELRAAGVDLINTDKVIELAKFLERSK